jgi:secreted Zn-dependent insulinase-like peptidase
MGVEGVDFTWKGFDDSMPTFVRDSVKMIVEMRGQDIEQLFNQAKEELLLEWKNFYLEKSYTQARSLIKTLLVNVEMEKK